MRDRGLRSAIGPCARRRRVRIDGQSGARRRGGGRARGAVGAAHLRRGRYRPRHGFYPARRAGQTRARGPARLAVDRGGALDLTPARPIPASSGNASGSDRTRRRPSAQRRLPPHRHPSARSPTRPRHVALPRARGEALRCLKRHVVRTVFNTMATTRGCSRAPTPALTLDISKRCPELSRMLLARA
jgi:hypothetical protein